jgi:SAM-dependent methyltransferase
MDHDEYAFLAGLYDYVAPYRARRDIDFYVEAAREAKGPVLELGCGTGRVLIPTARAGVDITGLDLSPGMLSVCRQRLESEPEPVRSRARLIQADMRGFKLAQAFRLATIPFRPFQHLTTVADQLACLATIHGHLDDGGRLIFDIFNPSLDSMANRPAGEELEEEPEFATPDGRRILRRYRTLEHDRFNQVHYFEFIYYITHPGGRRERVAQPFAMRYLFRFEAEHLLARAGFEVEHLYADFDKIPYSSKYPGDLIFEARKKT